MNSVRRNIVLALDEKLNDKLEKPLLRFYVAFRRKPVDSYAKRLTWWGK